MSTPESPGPPGAPEFTEEELRALEAEMDRISVDDVLLQTVVSLVNLGARRAGLAGPDGPPADLEQTRQAIEGARALLPLLESRHGEQLGPVREALSRLQMAYVRQTGQGDAPAAPAERGSGQAADPAAPGEGTGSAQSSGRLWVPGQ
jgi:hypothetical protein